jgi:hypothetical protein
VNVKSEELRCWVEDPGQRPGDDSGLRERKHPRFAQFMARPESDLIIDVLWHYIRHVPRRATSERNAWSLSCLPGGGSPRRLAVVSMRTMEVIVAGPADGFMIVSEEALVAHFGDWDRFSKEHPGLEPAASTYRDAGHDQVMLRGSLPALHDAIIDDRVGAAIRSLTARVYALGRTIHWRGHCPQLADLVLDDAVPRCTVRASSADLVLQGTPAEAPASRFGTAGTDATVSLSVIRLRTVRHGY